MSRSRRRAISLTSVLSLIAVIAIAYGASGSVATAAAKSSKRKHHTTKVSALSGTWSGNYSGAFSGTFVLNWTQSGSKLSGTIKLSNPSFTLGVSGTVAGSSISFGTVGGSEITYTGSQSGKSISGSYQTPKGGGSWSAGKTS